MFEFFELISSLWPAVAAMLCLILVSGFFSASETALFSLSHNDLEVMRSGRPRDQAVIVLLSEPDRLLTAVLFWNLVINLTFFAVSMVIAHRLAEADQTVAAGVFGMLSLLLIILFGEVLPKSLAVAMRRQLASLVVWPLVVAVRLLDPVTPVLEWITKLARRAFWPHIKREPFLMADDLERAVKNSQLSDEVIRQERQVLHNILDLCEITVEEVMRPRGTYMTLPSPVLLADLNSEVPSSGYLVVQQNGTDEIEGAIPFTTFTSFPRDDLQWAAEEVVHVPWCANLAFTLQFLRDQFCSLASVINEYGETIGILTYEDIIDTILMPEPSRTKRLLRREPVQEVAPGCFQVEGMTTLRYLCRRIGLDYEPTADGLFTVAGMLYEELEHIPVVDDKCTWRGYVLRVTDVEARGKLRVMVTKQEELKVEG